MKISDIQVEIKEHPRLTQLFVRVIQEDGLSGIGECWWGISPGAAGDKNFQANHQVLPMVSTIENILKPLLIGEDARQIEARFQQMVHYAYRYGIEGILGCALSGIDLALWDLAGKRLQVPVVELLGGQGRIHITQSHVECGEGRRRGCAWESRVTLVREELRFLSEFPAVGQHEASLPRLHVLALVRAPHAKVTEGAQILALN